MTDHIHKTYIIIPTMTSPEYFEPKIIYANSITSGIRMTPMEAIVFASKMINLALNLLDEDNQH